MGSDSEVICAAILCLSCSNYFFLALNHLILNNNCCHTQLSVELHIHSVSLMFQSETSRSRSLQCWISGYLTPKYLNLRNDKHYVSCSPSSRGLVVTEVGTPEKQSPHQDLDWDNHSEALRYGLATFITSEMYLLQFISTFLKHSGITFICLISQQ